MTVHMMSCYCFVAFAILATLINANVLQLVTVDSPFKISSQISKYIVENSLQPISGPFPVISIFNCGSSKSDQVVSKILRTNAYRPANGLCLKVTDVAAALCPSYQTMFQPQSFCGAKAVDFCATVSSHVCLLFPIADIEEALIGYDQVFRRLLWKAAVQKRKLGLTFLVVTAENPTAKDPEVVKSLIYSRINEIMGDIIAEFTDSKTSTEDIISLHVKTCVGSDEMELDGIWQSMAMECEPDETTASAKAMATSFTTAWSEVSLTAPKAILTPAQRRSLFQVETAYAAGLTQTEALVSAWRARVNNGKVVGRFGDRVQEVLSGVRKAFFDRTAGTLVVRERAERATMLADNILSIARSLLQLQLGVVEREVTAQFKKDLLVVLGKNPEEYATEQLQVVRDAVLRFNTQLVELGGEALGLASEDMQKDLSAKLLEEAKEFPESNAARLDSLRRMDRMVKKPKRKKGKRAVNFSLNLVGMLRPPGYGNLQGFVGYSGLSIFGIPLDTLFGVQNDGDAPEIIGEDREHPILRLQPKIHFDVDV